MQKNIVTAGTQQMTIRRMRSACWIPKATNTHSKYVIRTASPLQQWSHKRVPLLRHTTSPGLSIYPRTARLPTATIR
jgi:hypothetical protein